MSSSPSDADQPRQPLRRPIRPGAPGRPAFRPVTLMSTSFQRGRDRGKDLQDRRADAPADVVRRDPSTSVSGLGRRDVRLGEVGDVDVVADAGAVRRRVVVAEDQRGLAVRRARSKTIGIRLKTPVSPSSGVAAPATLK